MKNVNTNIGRGFCLGIGFALSKVLIRAVAFLALIAVIAGGLAVLSATRQTSGTATVEQKIELISVKPGSGFVMALGVKGGIRAELVEITTRKTDFGTQFYGRLSGKAVSADAIYGIFCQPVLVDGVEPANANSRPSVNEVKLFRSNVGKGESFDGWFALSNLPGKYSPKDVATLRCKSDGVQSFIVDLK